MRSPLSRIFRKAAELGEKVVLQVVVSLAATLCVAAITNTYLTKDGSTPAASQEAQRLDSSFAASLMQANFTPDTFRAPVSSIVEFAAVFGPDDDGATIPPVGREWSVAEGQVQPKPEKITATKGKPLVAAACAGECGRSIESHVLPPVRPTLPTSDGVAMQASAQVAEEGDGRRLSLLGLPLPKFIPSGETILTKVNSLGGTLTDLVLR